MLPSSTVIGAVELADFALLSFCLILSDRLSLVPIAEAYRGGFSSIDPITKDGEKPGITKGTGSAALGVFFGLLRLRGAFEMELSMA